MRIPLFSSKVAMGKAGIAAATGLQPSRLGYCTLVMSVDPAHSLAGGFDLESTLFQARASDPLAIDEHLSIQELNIQKKIKRHWREISTYVVSMLRTTGIGDVEAEEPARLPGMEELSAIMYVNAPGGGGNVANNLASLGVGRAAVLGVIGDDGDAHELTRALNARGISTDLLVRSGRVSAFTYTKLINVTTGVEDVPRVDFIDTQPLPDEVEEEVPEYLREFAPSFDIIFVLDQADTRRGVVTPAVRALLEDMAQADPPGLIWVDSRIRIERFRNMILKPNESDATTASIGLFGDVNYQRLRTHGNSKLVFVIKESEGVIVVEDGVDTVVPAFPAGNPVNVAGAALARAIPGSAKDAARFGNLVASITVKKWGTGVASPEEVLAAAGA